MGLAKGLCLNISPQGFQWVFGMGLALFAKGATVKLGIGHQFFVPLFSLLMARFNCPAVG